MSQLLNKTKEYLYENKKYFIIGAVLLVAGIILWDVFSSGNIGNGTEPTRQQLDEVSKYQQSIDTRLDSIEKGLNSSANRLGGVSERIINNTERVVTVERRIENSQARVDESQRIIGESRNIIRAVQQRNQE